MLGVMIQVNSNHIPFKHYSQIILAKFLLLLLSVVANGKDKLACSLGHLTIIVAKGFLFRQRAQCYL
jgi:hypothetical protein